MSNWTEEERETIVRWSEADPNVHIYSASPREIAKLREHARFTETNGPRSADGEDAAFVIPKKDFTLTKAAKKVMSPEELERHRERARQNFGTRQD